VLTGGCGQELVRQSTRSSSRHSFKKVGANHPKGDCAASAVSAVGRKTADGWTLAAKSTDHPYGRDGRISLIRNAPHFSLTGIKCRRSIAFRRKALLGSLRVAAFHEIATRLS
jgi:hypothetical protein